MNETNPINYGQPAQPAKPAESKPAFCFTDPGCRSDIRLGALLVLMAVFLWLWLGPTKSSWLYAFGAPLLLWGVPAQARQSRRQDRPGYPWKLGLAMAVGGLVMWPDLCYRQEVGGPVHWQPVAPLLAIAGIWILAWWPVARSRTKQQP